MHGVPADAIGLVAAFSDIDGLVRLAAVCRSWRASLPASVQIVRLRDVRALRWSPNTAAEHLVVDMRDGAIGGNDSHHSHAPFLLYLTLEQMLRRGAARPATLVLRWPRRVLVPWAVGHAAVMTPVANGTILSLLTDHLEDRPRCRVADLRLLCLEDTQVLPEDLLRLVCACQGVAALTLECNACGGRPFKEWLGPLLAKPLHTLRLRLHIHGTTNVSRQLGDAFGAAACGHGGLQQLELLLHAHGQQCVLPSSLLAWLTSPALCGLRRLRLILGGELALLVPVNTAVGGLPQLEFLGLDVSRTGLGVSPLCLLLEHFASAVTTGGGLRLYVAAEGNDLGSAALWPRLSTALCAFGADRLRECHLWLAGNPRCGPPPAAIQAITRVVVHGVADHH